MTEPDRIKPGILPAGIATPVAEEPTVAGLAADRPESLGAVVPLLPRRRGFRWGRALLVAVAAAVIGAIVIDAGLWVFDLFARSVWLGAGASLLSGAVVLAAVGYAGSEYRSLMRLRAAAEIRDIGRRLAQAGGGFEGRGFLNDLTGLAGGTSLGRALCERFGDSLADTHDDREALELFERMVLRPLDEVAYGVVRRAARDAAIGASVSPVAGLDAAVIIWRSLRMLREIGEVYGLRPTRLGLLALVRRLLTTATLSVSADVVGDVIGEHLGGRLAGVLSGKLAEGVFAGVRTARLGLVAVDQCRPLPFPPGHRPSLRQLVVQSLGSLAQPATTEK